MDTSRALSRTELSFFFKFEISAAKKLTISDKSMYLTTFDYSIIVAGWVMRSMERA